MASAFEDDVAAKMLESTLAEGKTGKLPTKQGPVAGNLAPRRRRPTAYMMPAIAEFLDGNPATQREICAHLVRARNTVAMILDEMRQAGVTRYCRSTRRW